MFIFMLQYIYIGSMVVQYSIIHISMLLAWTFYLFVIESVQYTSRHV